MISNNHYLTNMDTDDNTLRRWAASWCPRLGYYTPPACDATRSSWKNFPANTIPSSDHATPTVGRGMFTYVPSGRCFRGCALPTWGLQYGTRLERDAWVSRDMVGQFVLIRVNLPKELEPHSDLFHTTNGVNIFSGLQRPTLETDRDLPDDRTDLQQCWMFAFIEGYHPLTGKHRLVFKFDNTYYPNYEVDLEQCVFQHWTPPDIRRLLSQ